jgi:hypothetical protein
MYTYSQRERAEEHNILKNQETEERVQSLAQPILSPSLQRATGRVALLSPSNVLQLQQMVGNRAVLQMIQEGTLQRNLEEEEELPCPGSQIRSEGRGRGEGTGQVMGPIGQPYEEERR